MARIAIASNPASRYRRPRASRGSGTEASSSRESERSTSTRSPARQRSNVSATDLTGDTARAGTGNSNRTIRCENFIVLKKPVPARQRNAVSLKPITAGHGTGSQQRRSPAASTSVATIAGPYQTLFQNTAANLQILGNAISANPAPFLQQLITNQMGYAQTIAGGLEYIIQNFPAVLANLPANIQAVVQALLAFNPAPYVQQFIANQMAYAQIVATSLQNAAHDFGTGLQALPAAFQSAFQAVQTGDVAGAVTDIAQGFVGLLSPGLAVTSTGTITTPRGSPPLSPRPASWEIYYLSSPFRE